MCAEYEKVYESYFYEQDKKMAACDHAWILNAYLVAAGNNGMFAGNTENLYKKLDEMENEVREIRSSTAFRIASRIGRMNLPFKNVIKKIIYDIYELGK
jgi:tetrahydromethanopterin S-methyltransferase subunit G